MSALFARRAVADKATFGFRRLIISGKLPLPSPHDRAGQRRDADEMAATAKIANAAAIIIRHAASNRQAADDDFVAAFFRVR